MDDVKEQKYVIPKPGKYGRSVMMPAMVPVNEVPDERELPVIDISGPKPVLVMSAKNREPKPQGDAERAP